MARKDKARQRIVKVARRTHPQRHSQWVLDLGEGDSVEIVDGFHDLARGSWVQGGAFDEAPEGKVRVTVHIAGDPFYSYQRLACELHRARAEAERTEDYEEEGRRIMEEEMGR